MRIDSIRYLHNCHLLEYRTSVTVPPKLILSYFLVLITLIFLSGCATVKKNPVTVAVKPLDEQFRGDMVSDLLSLLPQILEPLNSTIQVSDTESGNAEAAVQRLVDLGYGIQRVDADQGSHFLYLTDLPASQGDVSGSVRLRLAIGDLEFTRSYRIIESNANIDSASLAWRGGQAVIPVGSLKVAGTRQTLLLSGINIQLAQNNVSDKVGEVAPGLVEFAALAPIDGGIPTISLITEDLVQRVADTATAGPDLASLNAGNDNFGNLFNGGPSEFRTVLDDYNRIIREFIIFPNDSQFLGKQGKRTVKKLVNRYSENSDLFGIIGCSNGPTSLAIGNEGLAMGRAQRIAEELIAAGISREKVLDEGCWSPTTDAPGFPNRGVVVDLWRRAG